MNYKSLLILILAILVTGKIRAQNLGNAYKIDLRQILELANRKFNSDSLPSELQKAAEYESLNSSSLDNPTISYGVGSLKYNGGAGSASYDEFSITQKIPINGIKTNLRKQGQILGKLGSLDGKQMQLKFSSHALLAAIQFYITKEKFQHIDERRKYFRLVSQYLKSREFGSPKQRIDTQLIENKLEDVQIDTKKILAELKYSKEILKSYIGDFDDDSVRIDFLDSKRARTITHTLSEKTLLEAKKFAHKEKYFNLKNKALSKQWIPDLQFYYSQTNERYSGGNRNKVIGVGLEIPIFNIGNNKKKSLLAQKSAARIQYQIDKNYAQSEKNNLLTLIQAGIDFREVYSKQKIKNKEERLSKFTKDFKRGLIGAANFLELEDQIHMIHYSELESHFNIYKGILGLAELTGDKQILQEIL